MIARPGFGLIELIVALTILAVGVLGLTAAAVTAHRAFLTADALQRAGTAAAIVIDSLMREPRPGSGARSIEGARVQWSSVSVAADLTDVAVVVEVAAAGATRTLRFRSQHSDAAAR